MVLQSHYRQPIEVAEQQFEDASQALARIDALARRFADAPFDPEFDSVGELDKAFRSAMDDDLDTPRALSALFSALRQANALADAGEARAGGALARRTLQLFDLLGVESQAEVEIPEEIVALVRDRDAARVGKDFDAADRLRWEIEQRGFVVEDTPAGTRVHR